MYGQKNKPLIVVFDEIDQMILQLNENRSHKYIPIPVGNKHGWNSYLDRLDNGWFSHVYILMTSNKNIDWFETQDTSYTRPGCVDLITKLEYEKSLSNINFLNNLTQTENDSSIELLDYLNSV